LAPKAAALGEVMQNNGHSALQGHSGHDIGTNEKPICDFLLVID